MTTYRTLDKVDVKDKRVLVRLDLNVPVQDGVVTDASRIERAMPTIRELMTKGAKVILLSHFDRPKGKVVPSMSLRLVLSALEKTVGKPVAFAGDTVGPEAKKVIAAMKAGDVALLENTRFHKEEEANDGVFAAEIAKLGDIYVNDAFSAAHRAHATTEGIAHRTSSYVGRAMQAELDALGKALVTPARPLVAIIGGAKISTKLDLLENLSSKVDRLVIGGGMANTFLAAQGVKIGKSLCEHDLLDTARKIMDGATKKSCEIILPVDAVVAKEFKANAAAKTLSLDNIPDDGMILDIGSESIAEISRALADAKTVVWNGPLGAFELTPFDVGTVTIARQVAMLTEAKKLTSVAGGGDTLAALNAAGVSDKFTYVSTAGGAFLEWLEGKDLPGVKALEKR